MEISNRGKNPRCTEGAKHEPRYSERSLYVMSLVAIMDVLHLIDEQAKSFSGVSWKWPRDEYHKFLDISMH